MKAANFIPALQFASHAMAVKDVRYFLNGVMIEVSSYGSLRLVCTDGHRMAVIDVNGDHNIEEGQYIMPTDFC